MTLLGFDTAMATASACVMLPDGTAFGSEPPSPERLLGPARHSEELLPEIERLLGQAGTSWRELESIAVGVGPGTFTGLRIGVATARALAQALGLGLRPVSSLAALARGVAAGGDIAPGGLVLALIDARRGQVFASLHRAGDQGTKPVWEPFVSDPEPLLERVGRLGEAVVCAGDWALESGERLERAGAVVLPANSGLHAVDALHVCGLGRDVEPVPAIEVDPIYLRLPDAEVNRRLAGDGGGEDR